VAVVSVLVLVAVPEVASAAVTARSNSGIDSPPAYNGYTAVAQDDAGNDNET
jgi:hypothetical protein